MEVIKRGEDGTETRVATLGPGQQFGEVAVFQRVRRTATVRATSRVRLVQIRREAATLIAGASEALHASLSPRTPPAPGMGSPRTE